MGRKNVTFNRLMGRADFFADCFNELKNNWKAEGKERIKRLNLLLISEKKYDELEEASRNSEFCNKLIRQYGI